ncbi:serine O-acetyltransferase EpsC [Streptomyces spirodelae]|uniref:serine O-acetyltransferase n=1 Tax=Streptomyces spirodelae TaxID=2812904 RepID=A0ABS3WSM9_9ACTN|nr:serine O-acetyltransferase EpsC [Streptomyces spirodelae]MBO8185857.1 serine acetyltransferase [Streptomyces spirodelae]
MASLRVLRRSSPKSVPSACDESGHSGGRAAVGRRRRLARRIREELDIVVERDPSVRTRSEALLHPSVLAVTVYRLGHRLYNRRHVRTARGLCMAARVLTGGIEIHPGATVGRRFFIDHGCGVVIGETVVIGDDVSLFHQVTLGSTGWWNGTDDPSARRHPKLGDGVTVGANASVLGPVTVGDHAVIGAQALVLRDVPSRAHVRAPHADVMSRTTPVIHGNRSA